MGEEEEEEEEEKEEAAAGGRAAAAAAAETMFPQDPHSQLAKAQLGAETGPRHA